MANMVIELKSQMMYVPQLREKSPPSHCIALLLEEFLMKVLFHSGTTYLHTTNYIGKQSNVKMHYRCSRKVKTTDLGTPWKTFIVKHYVLIYFMNPSNGLTT